MVLRRLQEHGTPKLSPISVKDLRNVLMSTRCLFDNQSICWWSRFYKSWLYDCNNDISRKTGLLFKDWRQDGDGIFVHQHKYAKEQILQKFGMESCNMICNHIIPRCKLTKDERGKTIYITKYKQIVGYLMYLDCH